MCQSFKAFKITGECSDLFKYFKIAFPQGKYLLFKILQITKVIRPTPEEKHEGSQICRSHIKCKKIM